MNSDVVSLAEATQKIIDDTVAAELRRIARMSIPPPEVEA